VAGVCTAIKYSKEEFMNNFMNKVTVLTLALIMAATAAVFAQYTPANEFVIIDEPDSIAIDGYVGKGSVVNIPPTILGLPVTVVGGFMGNTTITSVTIPDSVKVIGNSAFGGCTALTSVTIGKGVTEIGYKAFGGCTALKRITIPANVTKIDEYAFLGCSSLSTVILQREWNGNSSPGTRPNGNRIFEGTPINLVIRVPANSVKGYKDSWYLYSDKIQ
jgi:hypothetical protein